MIDSKDASCVETSNLHLTNEFIKVEQSETKTSILYCEITWPYPHEPKVTWIEFESIEVGTTDKKINEAISTITKDNRFFLSFGKCKRVLPLGLMHDGDYCHGCAEKYLEVTY